MIVFDMNTGTPKLRGEIGPTESKQYSIGDKRRIPPEVLRAISKNDILGLIKTLPKGTRIRLLGSEINGMPTAEQARRIAEIPKIEVFELLPKDIKAAILRHGIPAQVRIWKMEQTK